MSMHGQAFPAARHPPSFNSKRPKQNQSSETGFNETFEFLQKPLLSPEILGERLKEDLKRFMLLSSVKEYIDSAWGDVPKEFFGAMRHGILLAKQEALFREKSRMDDEAKREYERMRRLQEEEDRKKKVEEAERARLAKIAEAERLANLEREAELREKARASMRKEPAQAQARMPTPQPKSFASFQSESENSEWIKQETLVQAATLRKCLFLIKSLVAAVEKRPDLKKKRLDLRKDIRSKLGQIVNSKKKVTEIVDQLGATLRDLQGDRALYFWTLNFMAKQALKQAETEFAINSTTVYPVVRALIGLIQRHVILRDFLLVRFFKKCPYILPGSIPKLESGASSDAYRKRLGFIKRDGDEWEDNEHFLQRQGGIFVLFSSFFAFDSTDEEHNLFSLADAWFWIHRLMASPVNLASSIALDKLLETCGFKLIETYGSQAIKLLRYVKTHYLATLDEEYKAHNVRLEICVDRLLKGGHEPDVPEGRNYPVGDGGKWVRTPFRSMNPNHTFVNPFEAPAAQQEQAASEDSEDDGWGAYL